MSQIYMSTSQGILPQKFLLAHKGPRKYQRLSNNPCWFKPFVVRLMRQAGWYLWTDTIIRVLCTVAGKK